MEGYRARDTAMDFEYVLTQITKNFKFFEAGSLTVSVSLRWAVRNFDFFRSKTVLLGKFSEISFVVGC